MKTKELFSVLQAHSDKALLFEYVPGQIVPANYHITEVKHVTIDSVDCGANADAWKETVIQLWESPTEIGKTEFMTAYKALGILNKVGKMKVYELDAEVKFEYSNALFHTAQLFVDDYEVKNNQLLFKLAIEKTDCKAKETCGISEELVVDAMAGEPCCSPNGNCC